MAKFSTTTEERTADHFIVRLHVSQGSVEVYSQDAAFYVKEGEGWCFGAISKNGKPVVNPAVTDKETAKRMAERTAEMLYKAYLFQNR